MEHEDILYELRTIKKIMILSNADLVEKEIGKIANTDVRKKLWILINGKRMPGELAALLKIDLSTVSRFLTAASQAELIEYEQRNPPKKILDYVPPAWLELLPPEGESIEEERRTQELSRREE